MTPGTPAPAAVPHTMQAPTAGRRRLQSRVYVSFFSPGGHGDWGKQGTRHRPDPKLQPLSFAPGRVGAGSGEAANKRNQATAMAIAALGEFQALFFCI